MFVISGPSGVGKGTVVRRLLEVRPDLAFSVSATTRDPRPGEIDGHHYLFVSDEEFDRMVGEGEFLEWAHIFGHRSGTPVRPVVEALGRGNDVILEIDVQGASTIRGRLSEAVLVFLAPPSEEELARRLRARGTEEGPELERRLAEARREMSQADWFDHVVVNDQVEEAVAEVLAIIDAARSPDEKEQT